MIPKKDLERLKTRLLEERMVLVREMDKFIEESNTLGKDGTMDIGDEASELSNRQLLLSLSESERKKLLEIDQALERMAEGTYGSCAECGEPISMKRLEVKPAAMYCVACKALLEKLKIKEFDL
jgi:DnaK suppressor protein